MEGTIPLTDLTAFARVVDAGSFTLAARRLGVPKSTLSRAVARLEESAKVRLLVRTTRSMSLTDAGRIFYDRIVPHLAGLDAATKLLGEGDGVDEEPRGKIRITAPADLAAAYLGDIFARFMARYPRVSLEVDLTGRIVDLVKEGFDVALRASMKIGQGSYVAKKIVQSELHFYASPAYLARKGVPKHPDDLGDHELVLFRPRSGDEWPIRGPEGLRKFAAPGRIHTNDFSLVRAMLRAGAGIGFLPSFLGHVDRESGSLQRVLPEWHRPAGTLYFVTPPHRQLPKTLEIFRAFVIEAFRRTFPE